VASSWFYFSTQMCHYLKFGKPEGKKEVNGKAPETEVEGKVVNERI